jgi:hypothetical protein
MTKILNSLLIAASLFTFAPATFADSEVQITAEFPHDAALTAEQNYQTMLETAESACDILQPTGAFFPVQYTRDAHSECQIDLVEQGIEAFQREDLAAVHYAVTGQQIQLAQLTQ